MKKLLEFWLILLLLVQGISGFAQQDDSNSGEAKEYVSNAFTSTQLINSQTTALLPPNSWSFEIQHRFGKVGIDSSFLQQFLGLDLSATMRLAIGWSISDRVYIEIGRTNTLKTIDLESKALLVRQTKDFKTPFSLALYLNAAIRTERFPNVPPNAFYADEETQFYYKPSHRLSFNTQAIFSSKISEKFSVQLTPIFIYKNLAEPYTDNFTIVLSVGGRYKFGSSSSLIAEYAHVFNNRTEGYMDPISIGVEFATVGHAFQIFVSTSQAILETQLYTNSAVNYMEGEFMFGFNIQRSFWRKK